MSSNDAARPIKATRVIASDQEPQRVIPANAAMTREVTQIAGKPILEAVHLKKDFSLGAVKWFGSARAVHAVEDTSLALYPGKATALVGESGSGKTTVARLLARLYQPTDGEIRFQGTPIAKGSRSVRAYRRHVQYIFQDPFSSLNPVHGVRYHLGRALRLHGYVRDA